MTRNALIVAILVLIGIILWMLFYWTPGDRMTPGGQMTPATPGHQSLELASRPTGGDFELQSASGPVRLADLRGKVVLIYFGYTACPDICPTNLAFIASALKALPADELAQVRVLFVSVDPERDDLARLANYAAYFHPKILGITGTPAQVAEVAGRYGAAYRRTPLGDTAMGYLVDHSAYTYVVDRSGKLVQSLDHATPPDAIRAAIQALLAPAGQDTSG
ncbi:SCO family protein [Thiocystis violacea]|uniref:SCO family protein n=1 Tax=Thiocystis violacea TaxID=13725 RepID=UPI001907B17C|nr:SCO family protein [Thiocystis violacea]MBK1721761.1 SCO family protein [Thiocystis violacea]